MQQMCAAGMHSLRWEVTQNLKVVGAQKEWNPAHLFVGIISWAVKNGIMKLINQ